MNDYEQKSARTGAFLYDMEGSFIKNEHDLPLHSVFGNITILVDAYILVGNPGGLGVPETLCRPRDTWTDGIIEVH